MLINICWLNEGGFTTEEHATLLLISPLSGRVYEAFRCFCGQEGLQGASPPSFPHSQKDEDSGPQEGGRVQPNFPDHSWEAQGAIDS